MQPITVDSSASFALPPADVSGKILDLASWSTFTGYGPLPGIASATFDHQTSDIVGTRIRVQNKDGSSHLEEITEWDPDKRVRLRMTELPLPLNHLATHFLETWDLCRAENNTKVIRTFHLFPKSRLARPFLWLISRLLKNASDRHFQQLQP